MINYFLTSAFYVNYNNTIELFAFKQRNHMLLLFLVVCILVDRYVKGRFLSVPVLLNQGLQLVSFAERELSNPREVS